MMDFQSLTSQLLQTEERFKTYVARTIDRHVTLRNWLFGYYIAEYELKGRDRAEYGAKFFKELSKKLNLKGLSSSRLQLFKQFYETYPQILLTLSGEFQLVDNERIEEVKEELAKVKSVHDTDPHTLLEKLSFSHFEALVKLSDPYQRSYYEIQSIKGTWSVRELRNQIAKMAFERSACASDPSAMAKKLSANPQKITPDELVKTPYVFDFLNLPDTALGGESDLENALINDLRSFMLELGYGFCFEAQQKRMTIGGEYFFVDLVFYHRVLKCHVLIEVKMDKFKHEYAGQLNTYLQYYKKNEQLDTDNPPIGILLCTKENNQELIEFALGGMDRNLFVTEYQTALPTKEQLTEFLQKEKGKI